MVKRQTITAVRKHGKKTNNYSFKKTWKQNKTITAVRKHGKKTNNYSCKKTW